MIPSNKWFPTSLQERAAWYDNFYFHLSTIGGPAVGLTVIDVGHVSDDNDMMQFLASTAVNVDAYVDGVRQFRKIMTEGNLGDPVPAFPANPSLAPPSGATTGMFERLDDYVKRIRVAPLYTDEIGALLGINPSSSGGGPLGPTVDNPPVLKPSVDPGHVIEVKFTRGNSDGIYIETNVDNAGWTFAEKAVKSPAVFSVQGDGIPRGVQIRARFLDGNNPAGDWSDIVTVQTIP